MTTEISYTPDHLGLFSKMIMHFLNREALHIHAEKASYLFRIYSEVIQECIVNGHGKELDYMGYFTPRHLAAWNHTVINHLSYSEDVVLNRDAVFDLWHEIELFITDQMELFEEEEIAVRWELK